LRYCFSASLALCVFLGPLKVFADEAAAPKSLEILSGDSLQSEPSAQKVTVSGSQLVSLDYTNANLTDVLKAIAYSYNINIIISKDLEGKISAKIKDFSLDDALNAILSVHNYGFMRKGGIVYVCPKEDLDQATESLPLSFLTVKEAKTLLSSAKTQFKGTIQENEDTNTLVVTSDPLDMTLIKSYLKGIDVPPIQVMIDAKLVSISKKYSKDIGATMNVTYSPSTGMGVSLLSGGTQTIENTLNTTNTSSLNSSSTGTGTTSTGSSSTASSTGTGNTTQVNGSGADGSVSALLGNWRHVSPVIAINALVTQNKARVIASPSIATLNGHEASILIGDHYPYVSSTSTAGGSSGGVVNQTQTQYIDIGTKLKVTPFVSPDGWITLKVQPEVSSLLGLVNGNPDISTTSAQTEVRVRDNETIVIGGLDSRNTSTTKGGTPGLMSIPVLGWFFHHDTTLVDDGTLTVLITPHIVLMAPAASTENTKIAEDANLIAGLLDYAAGMDENRTKDSSENLTISEEQIKTYRRILEQFPQSGKTAFCLYRIAYIYVKDFGDCAAAEEALTQLEEAAPRSPYIKAVEILVNACMSVKDKGRKE